MLTKIKIGIFSILALVGISLILTSSKQGEQTNEEVKRSEVKNASSNTTNKQSISSISEDLKDIIPQDKLNNATFIKNLNLLKNKLDNSPLPSDELSAEEYELAKKITADPIAHRNLYTMRLRSQYKQYFRDYKTLSDSEKTIQAEALLELFSFDKVNDLFLPQEILSARAGIIGSLPLSEDEMKKALLELKEESKEHSINLAQSNNPQNDPELSIIKEVMDMDEIPNGLTEQEYLDNRIEEYRNNLNNN